MYNKVGDEGWKVYRNSEQDLLKPDCGWEYLKRSNIYNIYHFAGSEPVVGHVSML